MRILAQDMLKSVEYIMATQAKEEHQDRMLCFNLSSFTRVVTLTCLQGLLRLRCLHLDWNLESDLDADYDLRLGFQIEELEIVHTLLSLSQTFAGDYALTRLLHSPPLGSRNTCSTMNQQ